MSTTPHVRQTTVGPVSFCRRHRYLSPFMLFGRRDDPPAPGLDWERDGPWRDQTAHSRRDTIEYNGTSYVCCRVPSTEGAWEFAYGTPGRDEQSRGFLFSKGSLEWATTLNHPTLALVTDEGTSVVLEGGKVDRLDGRLLAFDETGKRLLSQEFDANVSDIDLSADGKIAAVQTHPPDAMTYLFNLEDGCVRLTHASDWASPSHLRLYVKEQTWYAYLSTSLEKKPLYAIDLDGTVVWESRSYRQMKPLSVRLTSRFS
jgi:hypothetical protein